MKKTAIIFILTCISLHTFAQFRLSGKLSNTLKADTFYINIPFVYGFNHDNDVAIPVDEKGNFNTLINVKQQKFGIIRFKSKALTLLLTPNKSLGLNYNPADSSLTFTGNAAAENRLLDKLDLNSIPFFGTDAENNAYAKLTVSELQQQLVKPWAAIRDKNIILVNASGLSADDKKLLIQEVKANYILQLNYFARGLMDRSNRKRIFDFIIAFYQDVPLAPDILPAGPQYYQFADSFIGYYETLAFHDLPEEKTKDPATWLKYYNLTIDSATKIAGQKGKAFLNWILVKNNYPKSIAGAWLAQNIITKCSTKDLAQAQALMGELKSTYPQSEYIPALVVKINALEVLLEQNLSNKDIRIADGYEKTQSIYQVIDKLKGKVVYLDIWGTWCGPCKEELRFNPQLKQYFKGKDVAFVYLDMDENEKDGQWRDFIKVNGITGLHLRKSKTDIQQFWDELMPKDGPRYYPMYFIFDKNGRLVQANAKRPSDKDEVYKQIEKYLND